MNATPTTEAIASTARRLRPLAAVAVLLVALFAGPVPVAQAATITVNTTDDELNSDGDCSLREAITAANTDAVVDACTAGSGTDTITVPVGTYALSIAGMGEDAAATGDLDVTGDLTIDGASAASTVVDGGGIDRVFDLDPVGSGVTVGISGVTVQNGHPGGLHGGGIRKQGGGTATLTNVTVSGNSSDVDGGGIYNYAGTTILTNVTVSGNSAIWDGGGIYTATATLTASNSTLSGNAASSDGGGMHIHSTGTATLTNVTVSGNSAASNGGGIGNEGGTATLTNTIVANSVSGGDCSGTITSNGYNLDSDGSCSLSGTGDLSNTGPQLGPLADNGGPTKTQALLPGSPAIDAGAACPATDQRGVTRPQGAVCDMGAYEVVQMDLDSTGDAGDAIPGNGTCATAGAVCTLRAAIQEANALAGADIINVPAGTYTLSIPGGFEDAAATGDLDLTEDVTITGAGAATTVIDGGGIDRVVDVDPGSAGVTAEISGVTVRGGHSWGFGMGIRNTGTLTVTDSAVSNNTNDAGGGGGIGNGASGTLTLSNTTISSNTATSTPTGSGGGIYSNGIATLTNVTVSGNTAYDGGGINNGGTATLTNVTVSGNSAASQGGGIYNSDTATLTNTIVANSVSGGDCWGTITSSGYNLDSDGTCGLSGTGDLSNTDPQLGPLADNGGPTQTHALLPDSPAIDAGDDGACPATDQRGVGRPVDGDESGIATCDMGAYEYVDNCPDVYNPLQIDHDGDGIGDVCDSAVRNRYSAETGSNIVTEFTTAPGESPPEENRAFHEWDYQPGGGIDVGAIVGSIDVAVTGLSSNGTCSLQVNAAGITLFNASIDNGPGNLIDTGAMHLDANTNSIPDGAEKYPDFLNTILDPDRRTNVDEDGDGSVDEDPQDGADNDADTLIDEDGIGTPEVPHARYFGVSGADVFQVLVFEEVANQEYRVQVQYYDPTQAPAPPAGIPRCAPMEMRVTILDTSLANGGVPGGDTVLNTPAAGTKLFHLQAVERPDADGDGVPTVLDNCPWESNPGQEDADADAIGDACEPVSGPCAGSTSLDCDSDGQNNAYDNCPTEANPSQEESEMRTPRPFGVPRFLDSLGHTCDVRHPTLVDEARPVSMSQYSDPICVTDPDVDTDGWCQADDPLDSDAAVTPEDDSVAPGSCSNGVDDDGDTAMDFGDGDCADADGDTIPDNVDNCAEAANPLQLDADADGDGDACEDAHIATLQTVANQDGANSELRSRLVEVAPQPLHRNDGIIMMADPDWIITAGGSVDDGAIRGALITTLTASVDPVPTCNNVLPVNLTLFDASTDPGDAIDTDAFFGSLIADGDANDLPDGVDKFPSFLLDLATTSDRTDDDSDGVRDEDPSDDLDNDLDGLVDEDPYNPVAPLARLFGYASFWGADHVLNVLVYSPGALPTFDADQGYPALLIINNPFAATYTGDVTAFCSPQESRLFLYGVSLDNPVTTPADESGTALLTNASNGNITEKFSTRVTSQPDLDGDGIENSLDVCFIEPDNDFDGTPDDSDPDPWNPRLVSPPGDPDGDGLPTACDRPEDYPPATGECDNADDDDFDAKVNDGCPQEGGTAETGAQCDNAGDDDGDTKVNDGCPSVGDPNVPSPPGSGADQDQDGIPNTGDNCVDVQNSDQTDSDVDGIGDACDPEPAVAQGSYQTVDNGTPQCSEPGIDVDKDGYCTDVDPWDNPSDPDAAKWVPEASAWDPAVCTDGINNDPQEDSDTDLDDDGCGDLDIDGVLNELDNCPNPGGYNPLQEDNDTDSQVGSQPFLRSDLDDPIGPPSIVLGLPFLRSDKWGGDVCDPDDDNDGLPDGPEPTGCEFDSDCDDDFLGDLVEYMYSELCMADSNCSPKPTNTCLDPEDDDVDENGISDFRDHFDDDGGLPLVHDDDLFNYGEAIIGTDPCTATPELALDPDLDLYITGIELFALTDPQAACAATPDGNDEETDAWPPDFNDDQLINIVDLNKILPPPLGSWGGTLGNAPYSRRRDLGPDGVINIVDLNKMLPAPLGSWGKTCP